MRNVYLDTETTSFVPGSIIELSMIIEDTDAGTVVAKNYFFDADSMDEGAQKAHGFSLEDVHRLSGGLRFRDYYNELASLLSEATLVAHNEAFDERYLSSEFWRCGVSYQPAGRACTMETFKPIMKIPAKTKRFGPYKNPKLSEVMEYLNISEVKVNEYSKKLFNYEGSQYHDTRFDTTALYIVVQVYREKLHGGNVWHNMFCA